MDDWKSRFKKGDRIALNVWVRGWQGQGLGPGGMIYGEAVETGGGGFGETALATDTDLGAGPEHADRAWPIRLDGYDYVTEGNYHTVWDGAIDFETNDDDIEAAIASIAAAVRNTKEK